MSSVLNENGFFSTPAKLASTSRRGSSPNLLRGSPSSPTRTSSSPSLLRKSSGSLDRFIPSRSAMDLSLSHFQILKENSSPAAGNTSPSKEKYKNALSETLFDGKSGLESGSSDEGAQSAAHRILAFSSKAPAPSTGYENRLRVLYSQNKYSDTNKSAHRSIPTQPHQVLDAPDILDDYYLNLLDWSAQNVLAVALGQSVYLWNASSGAISHLCTVDEPENAITSVQWAEGGDYVAVGTAFNDVQLWDASQGQILRRMKGHLGRVSSLAWNRHLLSSGSRDTFILNHDVRLPQHHISTFQSHQQEVCGLKWSPDGTQLASGGNDNMLYIWDQASANGPLHAIDQHQAAVKALAWCPWQRNLLASGGGTADRTIKFWNTSSGACLNSIDTKSQVCSLLWSKTYKELVSSHGYSQNQLCVWKYPTMQKCAELTGHTSRVLHMAMSPDGSTVVSAAGDETLRFWKVFEPSKASETSSAKVSKEPKRSSSTTLLIR